MKKLLFKKDTVDATSYISRKVGNDVELIGEGVTSLVFSNPRDEAHVIVATIDPVKFNYVQLFLQSEMPIHYLYGYDRHHKSGFNDVFVYKMPRLSHLSRKEFSVLEEEANLLMSRWTHCAERGETAYHCYQAFHKVYKEESPEGIYTSFFSSLMDDFLANMEPRGCVLDLHRKNIMKDKDGKLFITDPVIDRSIFHYWSNTKSRY